MVNGRPIVICRRDGRPVDVLMQNDKGYRKSIERGELWALHPATGRLLPYNQGARATIEDRGTWYLATVPDERESGGENRSTEPDGRQPAGFRDSNDNSPRTDAEKTEMSGHESEHPDAASFGATLESLAGLIATRHREMPEGSYTTHLFSGGSTRIRKKAGEEAVEVVLSADREELLSESADLLYHLLVLLEYEGVTLSEVAAELRRR